MDSINNANWGSAALDKFRQIGAEQKGNAGSYAGEWSLAKRDSVQAGMQVLDRIDVRGNHADVAEILGNKQTADRLRQMAIQSGRLR